MGRWLSCRSSTTSRPGPRRFGWCRIIEAITPGEYEAIKAIAGRLGMNPETLRKWIRQLEVDQGQAEGTTTAAAREIRELKRRNAELEQTVAILKAATSFFVRESDPQRR